MQQTGKALQCRFGSKVLGWGGEVIYLCKVLYTLYSSAWPWISSIQNFCSFIWQVRCFRNALVVQSFVKSLYKSSCFSTAVDGLGEQLCGDRHANPVIRERNKAMSPVLARWRLGPVPYLRGKPLICSWFVHLTTSFIDFLVHTMFRRFFFCCWSTSVLTRMGTPKPGLGFALVGSVVTLTAWSKIKFWL